MPTSNLHMAPAVVHAVHTAAPHRAVLDVGPGWGKYAVLLREYLNEPPERIDAVEAWRPYIEAHDLEAKYDAVYQGRVEDPVWHRADGSAVAAAELLAGYDVVLMVDVIEHMAMGAALDFLARTAARVVICTPVAFFDNGPGLPPTEAHVSHWDEQAWHHVARLRRIEDHQQLLGGHLVTLAPL